MLVLANLARNWWLVALQGAVAIIFGIVAFAAPGVTLEALVLLFAAWAIVDGVLLVLASLGAAEKKEPWWPFLFPGLLGIAAGLVAFRWPGITALTLVLVIAYWSILRGVLTIAAAVRLRDEIDNEWWLIASGAASVLFGAIVVISPGSGAVAIVWLISLYAIVFGVTLIALSFRMRAIANRVPVARAASR